MTGAVAFYAGRLIFPSKRLITCAVHNCDNVAGGMRFAFPPYTYFITL
jgi:hypothetical protein